MPKPTSKSDPIRSWQKLVNQVNSCSACSLHLTRTLAVPGEGSLNAKIAFIGEGPGKNEDLQGRPFVGQAGDLLNQLLESIDLKREAVAILNVVKCRPPKNRDPLPKEVETCFPLLEQQLQIIRPDLIVLLGRHSLERFLPGQKISLAHGHAYRRHLDFLGDQVFFASYHPAAALYNPNLKLGLFQDFKKIPALLKKIKNGDKTQTQLA